MRRKHIVVIGGGTGPSSLLTGLRLLSGKKRLRISAVIGMTDSGGSSGKLRDELGVLPPGDVLKALIALSPKDYARELLLTRFPENAPENLRGHTVGNLLLTFFAQRTKKEGYIAALRAMEVLLACEGAVYPATLNSVTLVAETNRRLIRGEGAIESWIYSEGKPTEGETILDVFLDPTATLTPEVEARLMLTDLVVIGPGSFFTSLSAVLGVQGMVEALQEAKRIAYVVNITTHPRETPGWTASTFVARLEEKIQRPVDFVICNSGIKGSLVDKYGRKGAKPVEVDIPSDWNGRLVISANFVREGASLARHDPFSIATLVASLVGVKPL